MTVGGWHFTVPSCKRPLFNHLRRFAGELAVAGYVPPSHLFLCPCGVTGAGRSGGPAAASLLSFDTALHPGEIRPCSDRTEGHHGADEVRQSAALPPAGYRGGEAVGPGVPLD